MGKTAGHRWLAAPSGSDREAGARIGPMVSPTGETIGPARPAREPEKCGFHALCLPERPHVPVGGISPRPPGIPLPRGYGRMPRVGPGRYCALEGFAWFR